MIKWLLLFFVSGLLVFALSLSYKLGVFKEVTVVGVEKPTFHMIYKSHFGPYHTINSVISDVEAWAKEHNFGCVTTFGEYLDDPNAVEEQERLRSLGGCLVPAPPQQLPEEIKFKTVEQQSYLVLQFSGSPAIGPYKVYPAAEKWFQDNRHSMQGAVIETYKTIGKEDVLSTYYFPIK